MEDSETDSVVVLGGGISGLSTAWYLKKKGVDVTLFEADTETGGVINSECNDYSVFDFGPNTIRDKAGTVSKMIHELGLETETLSISEASKTRYIVKDGELKSINQNPVSLLFSDLLSLKGKKDLFLEPFRKSTQIDKDESIGDFLERRIGKEAVAYLADPFFSGIYAGDIYSMSKKKLLRTISDAEQQHGSVLKGLLKNRSKEKKPSRKPEVLSFKKGVQQLTKLLSLVLSNHIQYERVESLELKKSDFLIKTLQNEYTFDKVISCLPAYELEKILNESHQDLKSKLLDIDYPPMLSTQLVFRKEDLILPEKGFGFLVPRKEQFRLLGAIWKSNIFPSQTRADYIHVNLMTGGAHDTKISAKNIEEVELEVLKEFSQIMKTEAHPSVTSSRLCMNSIPQFKVGYAKTDKLLNEFESEYKGLYIGGNYRWGVSVTDCIDAAKELAKKII
ncbi:MAG: protoporphyrinogen oxidase [Balneola sp.]